MNSDADDRSGARAMAPEEPPGSHALTQAPATPAWVKVFAALGLVFLVGFIVLHALGRGMGHHGHGSSAHHTEGQR